MDVEFTKKIIRVLKKLLEPDFKVKNDVYLNSLLTHLTGSSGEYKHFIWVHFPIEAYLIINVAENGVKVDLDILNKQHIPTWLIEAVTLWESLRKLPPSSILSFTLNLASFICKDEQTFVMLNAPTIKLAYIRLVSSLLEHKSGLQWIISTNYWADIMCVTLGNQTIYITKEGYKFLAMLLDKSIKINEMFCFNVVQLVMAPLSANASCMPRNTITNAIEVRNQTMYQTLCPSLTLITQILEIFLENINKDNSKVFLMFTKKFKLEEQIRNVLLIAQNEEFIFDLNKLLFIISLFDLIQKFGGKEYIEYEKASHEVKLFDIFTDNITKGSVHNVIKLAYIGHIYWRNVKSKMPICVRHCDSPLPVLFENQMLMVQLFPIISVSLKVMGDKEALKILDEDEIREQYVDKMLKNATPITMRLFYHWRNCCQDTSSLFDHATLALNYLVKSKNYFTRDLGITAFQTLIYSLQDSMDVVKKQPQQISFMTKQGNYFAQLLDTISMFINEFSFNWRDSLESFCVLNIAFDFLSIPAWSTKVDNVSDTTVGFIGPMLYAKLHDSCWEVRDTALEVICTIANNANKKFPSYRRILLEADLPSLILKMSKHDGEAFVRTTAIKCMQELAQVSEFWCKLSESGHIPEKIIEILQKETEGIVRSQAATLIATIYEHQDVPAATLSQFYDIMTHAATADLHWEVKVNALHFWEKVINRHLMHQGMIDGTFPKVTFSKEHRKIVTLNEPEVRKRLIKVLNQLSETGCLAVLITALQDDCDLEVSKTATKITKDFVKLLKDYNIGTCDANLSTPPSPLIPFNGVPSPPYSSKTVSVSTDSQYHSLSPLSQLSQNSMSSSPMGQYDDMTDTILDEIISSQDYTLLKDVFNPGDQPSDNYISLRFRQVVTPNDFLKFTYTDLESHADERTKWMDGMNDFGSLLDDILKEYDDNDVNNMDCY
ncbi:hypothetical protein NQ314_019084 [Rhamnusium bicolor]|uniref:BRCA1-associated ATM activator 1 n=1 Tax=Rhamnusium bicolor TaxID=1586634 RepID=A0AAV8WPI2_9CUCU|nr:hypothetical protein NQ314_019084 [Rhamnusium bicolor]